MSNQHEWTVDSLARIGLPDEWLQPIADAHNAALAAEVAKTNDIILKDSQRDLMSKMKIADIEQLRDQLAVERELREGDNKLIRALAEDAGIKITASDKMLGVQWEQFHDGVMQLREQLAAKDELHAAALQVLERHHQQQLTAERGRYDFKANLTEEIVALVDALNLVLEVRSPFYSGAVSEAEADARALAALAKYPLPDGRTH